MNPSEKLILLHQVSGQNGQHYYRRLSDVHLANIRCSLCLCVAATHFTSTSSYTSNSCQALQPCLHVAINFRMSSFHCTTDYNPQEDNPHNHYHKRDLTLQQTVFRAQLVSGIKYTQQL